MMRFLKKILAVISFSAILVIGSCLDSVPLTEWRVWAALLASMVVFGVCAYDLQ